MTFGSSSFGGPTFGSSSSASAKTFASFTKEPKVHSTTQDPATTASFDELLRSPSSKRIANFGNANEEDEDEEDNREEEGFTIGEVKPFKPKPNEVWDKASRNRFSMGY